MSDGYYFSLVYSAFDLDLALTLICNVHWRDLFVYRL